MYNISARSGRKRRMGFGKRGKNSFTVHRSEEVIPGDALMRLHPNTVSSRASSQSSDGEGSNDGDRLGTSRRRLIIKHMNIYITYLNNHTQ